MESQRSRFHPFHVPVRLDLASEGLRGGVRGDAGSGRGTDGLGCLWMAFKKGSLSRAGLFH